MSLGHPSGLRLAHEGFPGCPDFIPWSLITDAHRQRALWNHGQTMERLNERGGLAPTEFHVVLLNRGWYDMYGWGTRRNGIGFEEYYVAVDSIRHFLGLGGLPPRDDQGFLVWREKMRL